MGVHHDVATRRGNETLDERVQTFVAQQGRGAARVHDPVNDGSCCRQGSALAVDVVIIVRRGRLVSAIRRGTFGAVSQLLLLGARHKSWESIGIGVADEVEYVRGNIGAHQRRVETLASSIVGLYHCEVLGDVLGLPGGKLVVLGPVGHDVRNVQTTRCVLVSTWGVTENLGGVVVGARHTVTIHLVAGT